VNGELAILALDKDSTVHKPEGQHEDASLVPREKGIEAPEARVAHRVDDLNNG
jgi:hypothetical protein